MPLAKNIMGAGVSAGTAGSLSGPAINTAISAAGTTQATATQLTADSNFVGTVGSGSGVILYNGQVGDSQIVFNDAGSNSLTVYPPVGSKINNLATNAGFSLGNNTAVFCEKVTSTRWVAFLSA